MSKWLSLILAIACVRESVELFRGRDAKPGEFPFIVRILISQDAPHENELKGWEDKYPVDGHTLRLMHSYGDQPETNSSNLASRTDTSTDVFQDHEGTVSAGVLITLSRVLTTCDSVGFFTGQKVNLYSLHTVSVMAGSVNRTGEGGEVKTPSSSNVHPLCYFLTTKMSVLFNYGIYQFNSPFESLTLGGNIPLTAPIQNSFQTMEEMETVLQSMTSGYNTMECYAAGWGNYKQEFEGRGMPDYFERFSSILQTTSMGILDYPECDDATCEYFDECLISIWESGYVCAKASVGGPCNEDNGAPLICGDHVFGIHINPQSCTKVGYPRLFLRIDLAFNYVFDIKSQSHVSAVSRYTVIASLLIIFILNISAGRRRRYEAH